MAVTVITDPSRVVGENDVAELLESKWVAVHNPIIFQMSRKDDDIFDFNIIDPDFNHAVVKLDSSFDTTFFSEIQVGSLVYLNCDPFTGVFTVTAVDAPSRKFTVLLDQDYVEQEIDTGDIWANLVSLPGYYVEVKIYSVTDGTEALVSSAKFQPFSDGSFFIDPHAWLKRLAVITDEFDYTDISWRDLALANGFKIKYRERYNAEDPEDLPSYSDPGTFYWVNAAKQIGDTWGQNMGEYVTFNTAPPDYPAKFLTLFAQPVYWPGFPFEIAFIRSQDLDGLDLEFLLTNHDASGTAIGFGIQDDIEAEETGVIRFFPDPTDISGSAYSIQLRILDGDDVEYTEVKTVQVSHDCTDFPVYLKWINTLGGWSYWLFAFDQQKSINVGDAVTFERNITELSTADNKLQYLSKRAFPKIVCGANDVSAANFAGLKGLLYSPVVMMLTNPDTWETDGEGDTPLPKWQTVLVQPGSFNLETTRGGFADVEITLQLSEINVQTQ